MTCKSGTPAGAFPGADTVSRGEHRAHETSSDLLVCPKPPGQARVVAVTCPLHGRCAAFPDRR